MFCKHLLVYINSKVPFHENLPPLPSHRSGVPACSVFSMPFMIYNFSNFLATFEQLFSSFCSNFLKFPSTICRGLIRSKNCKFYESDQKPITRWLEDMNFIFSWKKTIFYSFAALIRKILFSPLADKIHIVAPPCNILYIL
jgi:hypothetical protein